MRRFTAADPETKSPDFAAANLAALRALFPELISEGSDGVAVNLNVLKQLVGDKTFTDAEEKYGLNWHGKRRARQIALTPSNGTLRPCVEDSVDWDTTRNLMIEGDNLEVLKLLQKSYAGKVKLIYIDPPYNTGKDFVYPDNFQDNIKNYLELTGQTGEGGKKLSSNTEASGRFHTDWLNMMYPRLKLARNLLGEDGVILVSIDDHEIENVRRLCNEVFGEENFIANVIWEKGRKNDAKLISVGHEYVLVFAKSLGHLRETKTVWREEKPGAREIWEKYLELRRLHGNNNPLIETHLQAWFSSLPKTHPSKKWSRYKRVDANGPWRDRDISWPGGGGPRYDVNCCDKHGIYLVETAAVPDKYALYDPAEWIDPCVGVPDQATSCELRVAESVRWIHAQRSAVEINEGAIEQTLHAAIADMPHNRSVGRISLSKLEADVEGLFGDAIRRLDPPLLSRIRQRAVFERMPVVRALLLAQFVGLKVEDLFGRAVAGTHVASHAERVELASRTVEELRNRRPEITRTEILKLEPFAYCFLKKRAPDRFAAIMPAKRLSENPRKINWTEKDHELAARFAQVAASVSAPFVSMAAAIDAMGVGYWWFSRYSSRLPETKHAIVRHVQRPKPRVQTRFSDPNARMSEAKRQLEVFRLAHPTSGSAAFREQEPWAYRVLIKYAPHMLELLPQLNSMDWTRRDTELFHRIQTVHATLPWDARRCASGILKCVGESSQLLSYAKGRLPKTAALIDSILVSGLAKSDISAAAAKLAALVAANPGATRQKISDSDPLSAGQLKRGDEALFEQLMPKRTRGGRRTDWSRRDVEFTAKIEAAIPNISRTELGSPTRIMKAAGITPHYLLTSKGRLPNTEKLLASLVTPVDMLQEKRRKLEKLVQDHPGLGREQLRLLDRTTAEFLLRKDRDFYNATMPPIRKVAGIQEDFGDERE